MCLVCLELFLTICVSGNHSLHDAFETFDILCLRRVICLVCLGHDWHFGSQEIICFTLYLRFWYFVSQEGHLFGMFKRFLTCRVSGNHLFHNVFEILDILCLRRVICFVYFDFWHFGSQEIICFTMYLRFWTFCVLGASFVWYVLEMFDILGVRKSFVSQCIWDFGHFVSQGVMCSVCLGDVWHFGS